MENFSTITVREPKESKVVKIGSSEKPKIAKKVITKWQSLIDTIAKVANVPSGLIMQLNKKTIEVFVSSHTEGNPYKAGEKADLIYGLYCETAIGTQDRLHVPDATKDKIWKDNNPDVEIDMISYLGFPINWPDGEVFGTVCLLDNKENNYTNDLSNLLNQIKNHLESDLQILYLNKDLKVKNKELTKLNNTKTKFLSLISHDVRGTVGTLDAFLKLILEQYSQFDKEQLKPMFESLSKNAHSSFQALENLLAWSKNDLVQLKPQKVRINVIETIEGILSVFEHEIFLKSLNIMKEYSSRNVYINVDENMVTVILRNIVSNAIKFTKNEGTIFIRVFIEKEKTVIEIEDNGVGMDKSTVDNLFSYNKEHKKGTKGESSAGIGLILAKEFMDKNDVEVSVDSEKGKGTTFKLTI